MPVILQVCLVVATIAFVAVAVAVVRALNRLSKTAEHLNDTIPKIQKSIDQIDKIADEAHELVEALADMAPSLRRTASLFDSVTQRAAGLSHSLLDEVEGPVRGAAALIRGVRAGADVLLKRRNRRHDGDGESAHSHGEFDDE